MKSVEADASTHAGLSDDASMSGGEADPEMYYGEDDAEMYDVDCGNNNHEDEIDPSVAAAIAKVTKNFRSKCWKEFAPIVDGGVVVKARCKHCDELIGAKRGSGTSALLNHLRRCKKRSRALKIVEGLCSTLRSPSGARLEGWHYDPDTSRHELFRMISLHGLPFKIVDYDGFRRFVESLNPLFSIPCRTTTTNGIMKDFAEKKLELLQILKDSDSMFSLTADMWTSNQTLGYICVTCHFLDKEWKMQKRILKYIDVKTPHTGVELFNNILNCIQDWGIEDRLFGITLDNASVNDTMVGLLRDYLVGKQLLHVKGKLLHHRCAGHVINLVVKDGLKFVEPIIENIRESVKYIRSSQSRKQMFKEIVIQEGIKSKKQPRLDVTTRWNSTFLMLKIAIQFRKAFESMQQQDARYTFAPSSEQWERAEVLCRLLETFNDATNLVSGSKYPTSNLYFHEMWKIKLILEKEYTKVDPDIANLLKAMTHKFNKYWMVSYELLCLPVVLDPRYKLKFIDFLFKDSFPSLAQERIDKVKKLVKKVFSSYSAELQHVNGDPPQQHEVPVAANDDPWAAWDHKLSMDLRAQASSELDRYLNEKPIPPRTQDFDILKWWMGNTSKYPILARIAKDVLAVPASSVASESAFSIGKRILNDFRSSLAPETVEALICLQDWYRAEGSTKYSLASIYDETACDDEGRQVLQNMKEDLRIA